MSSDLNSTSSVNHCRPHLSTHQSLSPSAILRLVFIGIPVGMMIAVTALVFNGALLGAIHRSPMLMFRVG